jgi:acyl dehydratase
MNADQIASARVWTKCRRYEEFFVGQVFDHHWGRTVLESDAITFSTITLSFVPLYFNREYAKAHGHPDIVVNPLLVFNVVLGMSVQDCSEGGGFFLGARDGTYHVPVYPGATITARSETIEVRPSSSRPGYGVVSWRTRGFSQDKCVVSFVRSNLLPRNATGKRA